MKGESARRNLLRHPPETTFQRRARLAQEAADRRSVIRWAIGITSVTAAVMVLLVWLVVR
jgi:hypothetical protein